VALVVVGVALLAGSVWGDDDNFPFGPFRMYSTTNTLDDVINTVRLEGVDAEGTALTIRTQELGLRPAEVNGQVPRFRRDPTQLRYLAESYARANPDAPPLVQLTLKHGLYQLEDGKPVSYSEEVIATWRA
jgi:hypothetical protein